jgi:peptidoglycan-N-acetylglucosamine deacetylase
MRSVTRLLLGAIVVLALCQLEAQNATSEARASPAEPRITFSSVHIGGRYVALTFDDGPHATLTPKLLDLLAAHHIRATFFVIGENVAEHPDIVARASHEGHEIGSHSWSHPDLSKMSDETVRRQLRQTEDAIASATGQKPSLLRPPYGSLSARQKRWIHEQFGYEIILWDVDPLDWKRPGPTIICNRIVKETHAGSIILAHDIHAGTLAAMPAVLDQLEAKGFQFVTVSELIGMAASEAPRRGKQTAACSSKRNVRSRAQSAAPRIGQCS